jgi:hypothetical protein
MLKRLGAVLVAATFIGTVGVTDAGAAQALDPGACGVRHSGPDQGADMQESYTVYNKCGYWINIRVSVQGQDTGCQDVLPHSYGVFLSYRASNDWIVKTC